MPSSAGCGRRSRPVRAATTIKLKIAKQLIEQQLQQKQKERSQLLQQQEQYDMKDSDMEDTMQNEWGTIYVDKAAENTSLRRNQRTAPACSKARFDREIYQTVNDFGLDEITVSGSMANTVAIQRATGYDMRSCMYGVGSYAGGDPYLQSLSTSEFASNRTLALPKRYGNSTQPAQQQSVPLAYWISCRGYTLQQQEQYEARCNRHLHKKLLLGLFIGKPRKAILMEFMLGGCGASLSAGYLRELGCILQRFEVAAICDEVLTGGRTGPTMAWASTTPPEFLSCVQYITMGKFMKLAIILKKRARRPTAFAEEPRGTSTELDCSNPSHLYRECAARMESGMIVKRRKQVRALFAVNGVAFDEEKEWGQGMMMYGTWTRWQLTKGLKNRLLPRLENIPLKKMNCRESSWTRTSVTAEVKSIVEGWIEQQSLADANGKYCLYAAIVDYIFDQCDNGHCLGGELRFSAMDIIEYIGKDKAEAMAVALRPKKTHTRSANSFVHDTMRACLANTDDVVFNGSRIIWRKRLGNKRGLTAIFSVPFLMKDEMMLS